MSLDIRPNPSATGSVTGGLVYKGEYNVTTNNPDLTTSEKGDFYIVNPDAGTLAGVAINVGDHIVFNQDAASPLTSAMFDVIDNTDAVASVNGATGVVVLDTDDISEGSSNLYYTNARFDTQLGTKDTDDLSEGTSNLYYTNARFDTQLGTKDTDDLSEGTSNLYYTNARSDARISAANMTDLNDVNYTAGAGIDGQFLKYVNANSRWEAAAAPAGAVSSVNTQTGAVVLDTDDISEGTSNLYYTNARFDTQLGTKDTDDLSEGTSNLYYTNARFDTQLGTKDTGDLSEGSNLYYTNARADARISAANMTDLNDVNYTAGAGIDGQFLKYVNANSRWEAAAAPAGAVTSVNTQTGAVVLDTDDISEGASNLYYTNARFDTQLGTKTTDNLTEGSSNLYYTNARFDTQLGTKDTGDLSEGSNLYYTNARADARISAANVGDLNDVSITSVANGEALLYNSTSGNWENGTVSGGGGSRPTVTEITSTPYTIGTTDGSIGASELERVYLCDSGASAVTLPTAIGNEGVKIQVKNRISSAITVSAPNPGTQQTIDGSNSVSITSQYESLTFVSDNTNWNII